MRLRPGRRLGPDGGQRPREHSAGAASSRPSRGPDRARLPVRPRPEPPAWPPRDPPAGSPPGARFGAAGPFEAASRRLIVFGGRTASPDSSAGFVFGDAWLLTEADGAGGSPAWIRLTPDGGPPTARLRASAAYSPSQNRLLVALGENEHLTPSRLGDVWVLSDAIGNLPL